MHLLLHLLLLLPASTVAVSSVRATVPEEKVPPAEEDAFIARLGIGKEDFTPMRRAPEVCFRTHLLYVFVRISYTSMADQVLGGVTLLLPHATRNFGICWARSITAAWPALVRDRVKRGETMRLATYGMATCCETFDWANIKTCMEDEARSAKLSDEDALKGFSLAKSVRRQAWWFGSQRIVRELDSTSSRYIRWAPQAQAKMLITFIEGTFPTGTIIFTMQYLLCTV